MFPTSRNWKSQSAFWKDNPSPEKVVFWSIVAGFVAGMIGSWANYLFF